MSRDFEDIVAVIDGREDTIDFLKAASKELREYVSSECKRLLAEPDCDDFLYANLERGPTAAERLPIVKKRLTKIAEL